MILSIIQGIFNKKSEPALNELVWKAKKGDEKVINDLLITFTPFIIKTASFVCNRFIDESDDAFSVAMVGFHEALLLYEPEKKRRLQPLRI